MHNGFGESVKFGTVEYLDDGCSFDDCTEIRNFKVDDRNKGDRLKFTPSEGLPPLN